ncbi:hypothetical protein BJ944DRAFT_166914 [Cunninghamella echinulata]|nr:hypothetical protein BJ944DRAFT_166914 [Cunninghamella echinulata]
MTDNWNKTLPKRTNLIITPKSGNDWGKNELKYFRIGIAPVNNFEDFFNEPPTLTFSDDINEILTFDTSNIENLYKINCDDIESEKLSDFIKYLISATKTHINEESAVDDFTKHLLNIFKYNKGDNLVRSGQALTLGMFGKNVNAKPDICVENIKSTIKLLIHGDKSFTNSSGSSFDIEITESQMVAEAIAAFQNNNRLKKSFNLHKIDSCTLPCIIMSGTFPIFYLFNITKQLTDDIENGVIPEYDTVINKYQIPANISIIGDVFYSNIYKKLIFQCYHSFRKFIN